MTAHIQMYHATRAHTDTSVHIHVRFDNAGTQEHVTRARTRARTDDLCEPSMEFADRGLLPCIRPDEAADLRETIELHFGRHCKNTKAAQTSRSALSALSSAAWRSRSVCIRPLMGWCAR